MSSQKLFVGETRSDDKAIVLKLVPPTTFWQRLAGWINWLVAWGLWTLLAFLVGYIVGAL